MCLKVDAAGYGGEGSHLSAFLYLMKGPHDDELTWPLKGKFEIKVLNKISDNNHHSMTVIYGDTALNDVAGKVTDGEKAKGWGKGKFIPNEILQNDTASCQYLKDNCLIFQVSKYA